MNKVILITGCSSGLGKLLVQNLSEKGHIVYATSRDTADLKLEFKSIKNVKVLELDITSDDQCKNVVKKIFSESKKIDVLINNAGYTLVGPTDEFTPEDFSNILNTNTIGAFRLIKEVAPFMKKQKKGQIINVTSLNGLVALPNFGLYGASKFALEALGTAFGYELKKYNIKVTNVEPGAINMKDSNVTKKLPHIPAREKFFLIKLLLPMISGQEVARKISELVDDENPPMHLVLGRDAKLVSFFERYTPILWNKMLERVWSK